MFFLVELYIQSNNKYYMLDKIEQKEDGSLYVFLPTNKKVGYLKKTSIHTSGRINFDLGFKKVQFIEPLIKITNINYICSIYIPSLGVLKEIDDQGIINDHKKNIVINFINNLNNYFTIDFFSSKYMGYFISFMVPLAIRFCSCRQVTAILSKSLISSTRIL